MTDPPDAAGRAKPPVGWFNEVCAALGLFDGARPVSVEHVVWTEVLPTIEALKASYQREKALRIQAEAQIRTLTAERDAALREEKHYHALYVQRLADFEGAQGKLAALRPALRTLRETFGVYDAGEYEEGRTAFMKAVRALLALVPPEPTPHA